jgi:pilus assembly protein Flp/PilA
MLNEIKHFATSLMGRVMVMREEGQALVEYTLILALVSVVAIGTLTLIGENVVTKLGEVLTALT